MRRVDRELAASRPVARSGIMGLQYDLAIIAREAGDSDAVGRALAFIASEHPGDVEAAVRYAQYLRDASKPHDAIRVAERLLRARRVDLRRLYNLLRGLYRSAGMNPDRLH